MMIPFMESCLPPTTLRLRITPCMKECARLIAQGRKQKHDRYRRPDQDLGSNQANLNADFVGALGEIVVYDSLERAGGMPEKYILLADRPPVGPDFLDWGVSYHIKTIPPGKGFLCVNERQRQDSRHKADYYLPVLLSDDLSTATVFAPIPASAVANWPLRKGRSEYRSCPLSDLKPLNRWEDLPLW